MFSRQSIVSSALSVVVGNIATNCLDSVLRYIVSYPEDNLPHPLRNSLRKMVLYWEYSFEGYLTSCMTLSTLSCGNNGTIVY